MRKLTLILILMMAVLFLLGVSIISLNKVVKNNTMEKNNTKMENKTMETGNETTIKYTLGSGDYEFKFLHDDIQRRYLVHVPPQYSKSKKIPVFMAIHGGGGNADAGPRYFMIEDLADTENFIVVYPEGTGSRDLLGKFRAEWDVDIPEKDVEADDVGYFSEMIDMLGEDFNIDEKRVYAAGFSQGSMISHRLACELSDKIAAIAAGGAHGTRYPPCSPSRRVPIFHFQGLVDPCSPVEGGTCGCTHVFEDDGWSCRSLNDFIGEWLKINGCSQDTTITFRNNTALCKKYTGCLDNAEVELCTIGNMGHNWPGNDYGTSVCDDPDALLCRPWKNLVGNLSGDMHANTRIWEFFKRHSID